MNGKWDHIEGPPAAQLATGQAALDKLYARQRATRRLASELGGVCEQDKWAYIAEIASEQGWGMCGISQDHEVVAIMRILQSRWCGDIFMQISKGGNLVRYWHTESEFFPTNISA